MMTFDWPDFLRDCFPQAGKELFHLITAAAAEANLEPSDFYSIRDLVELSCYAHRDAAHALVLALILALEEGSLCVAASRDGLARRFLDLVGESEAHAWAERILHDLGADGLPQLVGHDVNQERPVVLDQTEKGSFLYFQKYLRHERVFHEELSRRLQVNAGVPPSSPWKAVVTEVLHEKPLLVGNQPLELDPHQKLALGLTLLKNLVIISGGPGTGKTSLVLTLLRCLLRGGYRPGQIALGAPTGRAAQRLGDALRNGLDRLPSGRLSDSPDAWLETLQPTTLHQLLQYSPRWGTFRRHVENPVPADVVIIDEVSMVGVELMARLLQALKPEAKLVLLGDKDQLPSVEAGAVLASLLPAEGNLGISSTSQEQLAALLGDLDIALCSVNPPPPPLRKGGSHALQGGSHMMQDCVVLLQRNHRSQEDIRAAAKAVNLQDGDLVERLPCLDWSPRHPPPSWADMEQQGGCRLWSPAESSVTQLRQFVQHWAEYFFLAPAPAERGSFQQLIGEAELRPGDEELPENRDRLQSLFRLLERARILTIVREGPWGCAFINRFLEQHLRPRLDRPGPGLFAGAPVLITRNDHGRKLYNGDVGIALKTQGGSLRVVFPHRDSYLAYPADALPQHELGFALTVHKSQGSEYGNVLLILPPEGGRKLLTKEIIYTGITRAKNLVAIVATKDVLRYAIGRRVVRESRV